MGLNEEKEWKVMETYVLALRNGGEIDFDLGLSKHIGGGGHVDQEVFAQYRSAIAQFFHKNETIEPRKPNRP